MLCIGACIESNLLPTNYNEDDQSRSMKWATWQEREEEKSLQEIQTEEEIGRTRRRWEYNILEEQNGVVWTVGLLRTAQGTFGFQNGSKLMGGCTAGDLSRRVQIHGVSYE
jgi:hypothetical protein